MFEEIKNLNFKEKVDLAKLTNNSDILEILSKDEDKLVKVFALNNHHCPVKVLEELSKDNNDFIRLTIALNPSTPLDVLKTLSNDKSDVVRYDVLNNPNVTKDIIEKLSLDDDMDISAKALEKLDSLNINLKDTIEACSINVDSNESTYKNNHKHR